MSTPYLSNLKKLGILYDAVKHDFKGRLARVLRTRREILDQVDHLLRVDL